MRVKLNDLVEGLRASYRTEAEGAAGSNRRLSRKEQAGLPSADLAAAADSLERSGVARPFEVDDLVARAVFRAKHQLARVNQRSGTGRALVSREELEALGRSAPALGTRAQKVWEVLKTGGDDGRATLEAALAPYLGPNAVPIGIEATAPVGDGRRFDIAFARSDGAAVRAQVEVRGGALAAVALGEDPPAVDPSSTAHLAAAVGPGTEILGQVPVAGGHVVAYERRDEQPAVRGLATVVDGALTAFVPTEAERPVLERLAVTMSRGAALELARRYDRETATARAAGEQLPGPIGPAATLEAQLRTARLRAEDLEPVSPEESAVGFDPQTELFQWMVGSVLGDNAVFVTFDRAGGFRVEDFN